MNTDIPIPPEQVGTVSSVIELADRIARLYGPEATCSFVIASSTSYGNNDGAALVYAKPHPYPTRHIRGATWIEIFENAQADALEFAMSNRECTAADLGLELVA